MYVLLIIACPFVLFLLDIVLSVLLRYTDYDCPFGIFKLVFPLIIKKYELNVGILLISLTSPHFCACLKSWFGFPTSYQV